MQTSAMPSPTGFLITFCIGVAATLTWQSYGDAAREMIANSSPELSWLAPRAASFAQTASAIPSLEQRKHSPNKFSETIDERRT